ncbi:questin oxidase family protein [Roseateles sp. DB2]|uniref:questin oxidase family protein n=1 Tax=Roseateles sp. DB2 TaxID=3453717 RepID=UPI003EEC5EE5
MNEVLNHAFRDWARSFEDGGSAGSGTERASRAPQPKAGSQALLHQELDEAQAFGPAFDGAMSNHLPMVLHAAWEMGADARRLQALVQHERPKLATARRATDAQQASALRAAQRHRAGAAGADEWLVHRGQPEGYPWLQAYFAALLTQQPAAEVLGSHLEGLLRSPHAFAFHGLIRTAHAWESGHRGELAAALATWAAWWELLPAGQSTGRAGGPTMPPEAWAEALRSRTQGWRSELPMIIYRMRSAAETPVYADLAERLAPASGLLQRREQLLVVAREAYLHSRNFTVLHLITGLRALRVLLPLLPLSVDQQPLVAALDRAAVAGWMAGRLQWQDEVPAPPSAAWPALHRAALAQDDEHVIKGVHACWQEDTRAPDPRWRQVAHRMLEGHA